MTRTALKGRTYEEIYGPERAAELRRLRAEKMKQFRRENPEPWNKGMTFATPQKTEEVEEPVTWLPHYTIDLNRNIVNGQRVMPRVAELTYAITQAGGWLRTSDLILKLFGLSEPQDALTTLRGWAYQARKVGIPIRGEKGRGADGYYLADERLWT